MRDFLAARDQPATIAEIKEGVRESMGDAPASSYRSGLQDGRYFERVSRGIFKLKSDNA